MIAFKARTGPLEERVESAFDLEKLSNEIDQNLSKLRQLLQKTPALQTIAAVALGTYMVDPETYKEHEQTEPSLQVEYLTWLYLTMSPLPEMVSQDFDTDRVDEIVAYLKLLIKQTNSYFLWYPQHGQGKHDAFDEIRYRTRVRTLQVRGAGYAYHIRDQLSSLFDPFKDELEKIGSVECHDILVMVDAILKTLNNRFQDFRSRKVTVSELKDLYKLYLVTVDELAAATQIDKTTVSRFLETFSTSFGQQPISNSWPSVYEPLDRSPFLKVSEKEWMVHLLPNILHTIQLNLESQLAKDPALFQRYEKHRTHYLEDHAVSLIASTSKHAKKWSRLRYNFDYGKGIQSFELDGLVIVDDTIFLVEAKSKTMSAPARRGAESAVSELKELVGNAHQQAIRASAYLRSTEIANFLTENDLKLEIRLAGIRRVYMITVTLDELAAFTTELRSLKEIGVVPKDTSAWTVCDLDLRVVVEVAEGVGMFADFLDHRLRVDEFPVYAVDELDWFAFYIKYGLNLDYLMKDNVALVFLSFTEEFDAYYDYISARRKTAAEKPQRPMSPLLHELIAQLEKAAPNGFIDAVCALLDINVPTQETLTELIRRTRNAATKSGRARMAVGIQNGCPTCLCYISPKDCSIRYIDDYTKAVKYRMQRDRGIGILQSLDWQSLLVTVHDYPWKYDATSESLAKTVLRETSSFRLH